MFVGTCLVCRRVHVVFVGGSMSCLEEGTCLVCRGVHVVFVGGSMSCL